jgi:hypothetical protein
LTAAGYACAFVFEGCSLSSENIRGQIKGGLTRRKSLGVIPSIAGPAGFSCAKAIMGVDRTGCLPRYFDEQI